MVTAAPALILRRFGIGIRSRDRTADGRVAPASRRGAACTPHAGRVVIRCRGRAFTLAEVTIALAVLGLAVVAVTQAVTAGQTQTHEALHRARAPALAEAMVEEVLSKAYGDTFGAPVGVSRAEFTEIGHYHGFEESPDTEPVSDQAGEAYPKPYESFTRQVTVTSETRDVPALGGAMAGLLIEVTISDARGSAWTIRRFVPEPHS